MCYAYPDAGALGDSSALIQNYASDPNANISAFRYGLVAYLENRQKPNITMTTLNSCAPDLARDILAKTRWAAFLDGVLSCGYLITNNFASLRQYNLRLDTVVDPWGQTIRYKSDPPYMTYDLWSAGPGGDGDTVPEHAIHKSGKWDE